MDLPTKIVAEHLAARITDLEVELAEQAASVVVEGLVFVDGVDKLPSAVAGVRTLAASTAYYLTTEIDLEGDRLVLSDSTVLLGSSSETAILKSTGLDANTPLLTAESGGPNPIQNLRIEGVTDESGTGSVTITDLQVTVAAVAG